MLHLRQNSQVFSFKLLILGTDIFVCTIPNVIAYGNEKGIEVDGSAMDRIVLTVAIFEAVIGEVVWYLNLLNDWV